VLSTPPAFVLSQNQTLQTKTTQTETQVPRKSEKSDLTTSQNWQIKQNHPTQQEDGKSPTKMAKNNKQKPPNTLLSSQTTD
jgi:hypothetical protein